MSRSNREGTPKDIDMVLVQGGTFIVGEDHEAWANLADFQKTTDQHEETVLDFYIGRYLVTFRDYDMYCDSVNIPKPNDQGWGRGNKPVINITWQEGTASFFIRLSALCYSPPTAIKFCNWKSRMEGLREAFTDDGKLIAYTDNGKKVLLDCSKKIDPNLLARVEGYRLPLDSEWEYAAKGGQLSKKYKFIGGDKADDVAWFKENSQFCTQPVGLKKPNELGLYDMAGNVYEYMLDGKLPHMRYLRGGGWSSQMQSMRACFKNGCRIDEAHSYVGFRLARSKQPEKTTGQSN